MAEYMVFSPDGTLAVKAGSTGRTTIPESELRNLAIYVLPVKDDQSPLQPRDFIVKGPLTEKEIQDHETRLAANSMTKREPDGRLATETRTQWETKVDTRNPDLRKRPSERTVALGGGGGR